MWRDQAAYPLDIVLIFVLQFMQNGTHSDRPRTTALRVVRCLMVREVSILSALKDVLDLIAPCFFIFFYCYLDVRTVPEKEASGAPQ